MAVHTGNGSILKATISSVLTAIAQVTEIDGPSIEVGTKEITNLSDTVKKFRALLPDYGEVTFTIEYDPADTTHAFLQTTVATSPQSAIVYELDFSDTTHKATFSAFITEFHPKGMTPEDTLEADVKLKITGVVTFA
jgi:hypothetical protein